MDTLLVGRLKALAHPARLEILRVLASRRRCVCGEVVEVMPLAQATVSQHLKNPEGRGADTRRDRRPQLLLLPGFGRHRRSP
jgi:ArsR family transcriptional regulator